ncbi:MAG: hypothetical protein ACI4XF_06915 [Oscillospiraceae bacterium]
MYAYKLSPLRKAAAALIIAFAAILFLPSGVSASAAEGVLFDEDNALSDSEYAEIESYAQSIADKTGWNIAVEFDPYGDFSSTSGAQSYCVHSFESYFGADADGVYYFCADHYTYLITSGAAYKYISGPEAEKVSRRGDSIYTSDRVASINLVLDGVYNEFTEGADANNVFAQHPGFLPLCIVLALMGGGIFIAVIISGYKFHSKPTVLNYLDRRAVRFPQRQDVFVREYHIRHTNSSSSGGRSGGHHSGGGHSGGGGRR